MVSLYVSKQVFAWFGQNLGSEIKYLSKAGDCMAAAQFLTCSHWSDLKFSAHFFRVKFLEMFSSSPQSSPRASNALQSVGIEVICLYPMFC